MKKLILTLSALVTLTFFACKKSSDNTSQISLTASATSVAVGEQMSVTVSANANAINWTVSPSTSTTKTYGLTTSKVNYFTFNQAGTYTVSVNARKIAYDSTKQSLQLCWDHSGASRGNCTPCVDTASVAITVTGK